MKVEAVIRDLNKELSLSNEHINYKVLAKHFDRTEEAMRQLYRKFQRDEKSFWIVYVKAYNFDKGITK